MSSNTATREFFSWFAGFGAKTLSNHHECGLGDKSPNIPKRQNWFAPFTYADVPGRLFSDPHKSR